MLRSRRHLVFAATFALYLAGIGGTLATGVPSLLAVSTFLVAVVAWAYGPVAAAGMMVIGQAVAGTVMSRIAGPDGLPPVHPVAVLVPVVLTEALVVFGLSALRRVEVRQAATEAALREKNAELETALAEVKELRGMLPICAWCKSIRDVNGLWNSLEAYLSRHSRATLTHGMCPGCQDRVLAEIEGEAEASPV